MPMEALVMLVGAISAGLVALISSIFVNIRHSRCTQLKCCGCECNREIMSLDELKVEQNNNGGNNDIIKPEQVVLQANPLAI